MRVALLEDEAEQVERISRLLEGAGHGVHAYSRGRALLNTLRTESFDLIILDWEVPGQSGLEVLEALRARAAAKIPVLFLTHRDSEADVVQALGDDAGPAGKLKGVLLGIGFQFGFGGSKAVVAAPVTAPVQAPAAPLPPPPVVAAPPAPADSDGDGVFDDQDQCPDTPRGSAVDAVGCVRKGSITLVGVNFENDSARLLPESLTVLDTVAADLKRYPRLKVEVQGHTDSVGSDAYNQKLSQSRAESVRDRLVSQGVDAAQLSSRGYGEARPVTTNATPEGRSQNRRVALEVLENPGDVEVRQGR